MGEPEVRDPIVTAFFGFTRIGRTEQIPDACSMFTRSRSRVVRAVFHTELPPEVAEKLPPTLGTGEVREPE